MSISVLVGKPKNLSDKQLKVAIILGCLMLAPALVLSLLKGFIATDITVDYVCYALTVLGWYRVIACENHAMERRQSKLVKSTHQSD